MSAEKLSPERLAEIAAKAARIRTSTVISVGQWHDAMTLARTDVPALLAHIAAVEADQQFAKAEVERLRKGAMQHAKDWMESAAEALAQENENTALRAERDALAAAIAGMEKALSVLTDPGHCHIYGDGSVTLGYPGRIEDCYSAKCREQIAALAEAPATDEPECVCYESWAGHQSGCAFAKRGPATEGETK